MNCSSHHLLPRSTLSINYYWEIGFCGISNQLENPLHGLQIWLGLPKESEAVAPDFQHYAGEAIPRVQLDGVTFDLIAGEIDDGDGHPGRVQVAGLTLNEARQTIVMRASLEPVEPTVRIELTPSA